MSVYSKIPVKKPGRNVFILSHSFKGSLNIGELVPIARPIECVPGDTMITGNISKVDLSPIITNFSGELYFETWQFFVSNDMLYYNTDSGKFTEILASMQNPQQILPLPYLGNISPIGRGYLSYLYGGINNVSFQNLNVLEYPIRAVWKIINEWFQDENLETTYPNMSNSFYHLNYKKDRFTSAFLDTQKGNPITFNVGKYAPVKITTDAPSSIDDIDSNKLKDAYVSAWTHNTGLNVDTATIAILGNNNPSGYARVVADLTSLSGISINDLRLYNKLQKWLERNQLCGTRIKEYLLSNYGVTPNDETLQRPVLIGHTKVPVIVDEFNANIKATNATGPIFQNYQGSKGASASANSSYKYGKWFCKEFGWLITLGALRPKAVYTGGIHKSLTKDSVIDFFNPIFEHLGQQAVLNKELYVSGNSSNDNDIFGYQDIYNEMRHIEDFISQDLIGSGLQTKNIFRSFAATPTLSRNFIEVKPTDYDYLFAVPSSTAPQAIFNSSNIIKAVRPLSKRSTPSL